MKCLPVLGKAAADKWLSEAPETVFMSNMQTHPALVLVYHQSDTNLYIDHFMVQCVL